MKMKKFINAPETITDEELVGLGLAYPDIVDVDGHLAVSYTHLDVYKRQIYMGYIEFTAGASFDIDLQGPACYDCEHK